jgi:hemolysin D
MSVLSAVQKRMEIMRPLMARYRDVWHAAWAARHELAGPKRLATEYAFLPAALSVQETPPHPAPRVRQLSA